VKKLVIAVLITVLLISFIGCAQSAKAGMPVVLLTDYGNDDYRVPRMKGIIYNTYPDVEIIDATHGIPGMDIATGAYILDLAAAEFSANVVFIVGVGSPASEDAPYLVLLTNKDQIFVAANNGLLTNVINDMGIKKCYSITNQELYDRPYEMLSSHYILGRVGALIASGRPLEDVGPEVRNPVMLDIQKSEFVAGVLKGSVVFIDHFGSCLTNISSADFAHLGLAIGGTIQVTIAGVEVLMMYGTTYSSVPPDNSVAFLNSLGFLQLSMNSASFAGAYNIQNGTKIEVEKPVPDAP
jgi:S-adenosylmethionine hydrolase